MFQMCIVFLFSFFMVLLKTPLAIAFSSWFNLYDVVDFYRKSHNNYVSRLGGVAIFSSFMMSLILFIPAGEFSTVVLAWLILFLTGLTDDLYGEVKPLEKCFAQLIPALILFNSYKITSFYGIFGLYTLNEIWSLCISLLFMLFISNAFNLIDGIDGLAGSLGLLASIVFSILLFILGDTRLALVGMALSGAILGFLKYNFLPGKVFMGDCGSLFIGLVLAVMAIGFIEFSKINAVHSVCSIAPAIVFAMLIVPGFDAFRILCIRILHFKSPLIGDRNHIHHRLKLLGFSDWQIVTILVTFTLLILLITFSFSWLGNSFLIAAAFFLCLILNSMVTYLKGRKSHFGYKLKHVLLKDTLNIK